MNISEFARLQQERDELLALTTKLRAALENCRQLSHPFKKNSLPHQLIFEESIEALSLTPADALRGYVRREALEQSAEALRGCLIHAIDGTPLLSTNFITAALTAARAELERTK